MRPFTGRTNLETTTLNGRVFHVVKVVWSPTAIERRLADLGWRASVRRTGAAIFCHATRVRDDGVGGGNTLFGIRT